LRQKAFISEDTESLDELLDGFSDTSSKGSKATPLTDEQNSEIVEKIREIVSKYSSSDFRIYYAGSPSVLDALKKMMRRQDYFQERFQPKNLPNYLIY